MLELVDLGRKLKKKDFKERFPLLRERLRELSKELRDERIPMLVVFEGWDAAGKGTAISTLLRRVDPRGFVVHPISAPLRDEKLRPFLWRFWTKTPARGRIAVFDRSWYGRVLVERIDGLCKKRAWRAAYDEIVAFERQLVDDGAVVVKFLLHISKKEQKQRFKALSKDEFLRWKVTKEDWKHLDQYDAYLEAFEEMLEKTSTHFAPWTVVEATDQRWAHAKVFETIIDAGERAVAARREARARAELAAAAESKGAGKAKAAPKAVPSKTTDVRVIRTMRLRESILDRVDLELALGKEDYEKQLREEQVKLRALEYEIFRKRVPVVVGYEGWDAAGKGGNIKRLTEWLDPRGYDVIPVAAPTAEEKAHHHLWRFWNALPKAGHLTVFDRTWYGRVLVERVEGFCGETEWRRAYQEINEFEACLAEFGTVLVKFWIHISQEEQLARFEARSHDPLKSWKLTDEDWRNREKWPLYEEAVLDMLERTSTTYAPWTIVEGNDKLWARVKAIRTLNAAIERKL